MVRFEWDEAKNRSNFLKHGVDFQTTHRADIDGEPRWHAIGFAEGVILLVVMHTYRDSATGEFIRIVSARQATRQERKLYEAAHG